MGTGAASLARQLSEVPAGDLAGDEPEPGVPPVGARHRVAAVVLAGQEPLAFGELRIGRTGPRRCAAELDCAAQLRSAELAVIFPGVYQHGHLRVALEIGPALALDDRIDPQCRAVPGEPERGDVRSLRARGRQAAGVLGREERVELRLVHGDFAAAPLLNWHVLSLSARVTVRPSGAAASPGRRRYPPGSPATP